MTAASLTLVPRRNAQHATLARSAGRTSAAPAAPAPQPEGFVLYVDLAPDAFASAPAEVLRTLETLRELAAEWLPGSRSRAVLSTGGRTGAPTQREAGGTLRATLAAIPDTPRVRVDLGAQAVSVGGEEVRLTRKEFELFAHLAQADGRVVTRDELRATVWRDSPVALTSRTVDVHVRRLRAIPELAELIITVRGTGYRVPAHRDVQVVG